ncbi:spore coat protein [Alicyclobacillus sp. SO9]|uniref:spore coat protein n=1 Tax=Alicyclobacillus sp. SO9 TaxID=2665646 RepID=UPI0018E86633|nr:spore coat protein [Alicyclobacillus sp. SO9]QQE79661.1 spore coat protein [Alicyclobacillus sp. SO9]QQE79663.1 spore coat protein [Alicyclobacillus sp. SO9]
MQTKHFRHRRGQNVAFVYNSGNSTVTTTDSQNQAQLQAQLQALLNAVQSRNIRF